MEISVKVQEVKSGGDDDDDVRMGRCIQRSSISVPRGRRRVSLALLNPGSDQHHL